MQTAILFPGQGSQEPDMGRDSAEANRECMDMWKKAERVSGLPLREIYWEGDDSLMADTRNLQPALTVVNLSLWLLLAPKLRPAAVAGHSLGEYSALCAAGILSIDTVLELVSIRGALMAEADPDHRGAMAAVLKLPLATVQECVRQAAHESGEVILLANHNSPSQLVVSGTKNAVELVAQYAKEHKGRAVLLPVSGAFHSPLMQNAASELTKYLRKATWNRPQCPIYCNATGSALTDGESVREVMCQQMTSPVLWIDTINAMWNSGIRDYAEVGPKNVLSKLVSAIIAGQPDVDSANIRNINNAETALTL